MFASLKKLLARTTPSTTTPARPATLAVESLETREVPAGFAMENTLITGVHSGGIGVSPEPQPGSPATITRAGWNQPTNTNGLARLHTGWIEVLSLPIESISFNYHALAGPTSEASDAGEQQVHIQKTGDWWIELQSVSGGADASKPSGDAGDPTTASWQWGIGRQIW